MYIIYGYQFGQNKIATKHCRKDKIFLKYFNKNNLRIIFFLLLSVVSVNYTPYILLIIQKVRSYLKMNLTN